MPGPIGCAFPWRPGKNRNIAMAEVKLKVLEFANKVSRKKMGAKNGIKAGDPE